METVTYSTLKAFLSNQVFYARKDHKRNGFFAILLECSSMDQAQSGSRDFYCKCKAITYPSQFFPPWIFSSGWTDERNGWWISWSISRYWKIIRMESSAWCFQVEVRPFRLQLGSRYCAVQVQKYGWIWSLRKLVWLRGTSWGSMAYTRQSTRANHSWLPWWAPQFKQTLRPKWFTS